MQTITSKDAQNHFGKLIDTASKEPVTIERHGRPVAVVISADQYARYEALEDADLEAKIVAAEKRGYLSAEETAEYIKGKLSADA